MAGISSFEELIALQKSRVLVQNIYDVTNKSEFLRDRELVSQIRRASISVMSNIAEGFERGSPADFHRFLVIAKASCVEVRSQLYIALDNNYLTVSEFDKVMAQAVETAKVIGGLRVSVEKRK